jgi:hypothetical protein
LAAFADSCEEPEQKRHVEDRIAMIDQKSRSFPNAMDHVLGKRVFDAYIFSDALVKMGGSHPEEEQGQYLMYDRAMINVRQDPSFRSTIAFRLPSPFFRNQPPALGPILNHVGPAPQRLRRDAEPPESEKESDSDSEDLEPLVGKKRAYHQTQPSPPKGG